MAATKEAFKELVAGMESAQGYVKPAAFGIGIKRSRNGKTIDVFYPQVNFESAFGTAALLLNVTGYKENKNAFVPVSPDQLKKVFQQFEAFHGEVEQHPNIVVLKNIIDTPVAKHSYYTTELGVYFLFDKTAAVESAEEGYFKLQLLSNLCVKPHQLKLDGIFAKLNNIAWTNRGPMFPEDIRSERTKYLMRGEELVVSHVDKFPYMVNYTIPEGVRVASGAQVRLGAHLSPGTTVMPAGYVNFNAGTLGNAMVEGRISAGVVVGDNTDIGGGASIMGTLSGGNKNIISLGEKCLLGANSGTGISLGFGCTIEAGLYITASSKIHLYNEKGAPVNLNQEEVAEGKNVVKAMDLNGKDKLLFIRDSISGKIICKPNPKTIELNAALHKK